MQVFDKDGKLLGEFIEDRKDDVSDASCSGLLFVLCFKVIPLILLFLALWLLLRIISFLLKWLFAGIWWLLKQIGNGILWLLPWIGKGILWLLTEIGIGCLWLLKQFCRCIWWLIKLPFCLVFSRKIPKF